MPAAQRTAWDAYLTVAGGLLPACVSGRPEDLLAVVARIERYATLWGEHGPMLLAAVRGAQAMLHAGDRANLIGLLRAVADRLYLISAGARPSQRRRCPRNLGAYRPGPSPRRRGGAYGGPEQ